jgi:hypothetical protein
MTDIEKELLEEIEQEKKVEEPTTAAGMVGAVTRGAAKPLTQAITGGMIGGAMAPYAAPVSIPLGAGLSVIGSQVSEAFGGPDVPTALGQLTTTLVNKFAGTHYSAPEDATTELLDRLGVQNPRSNAEEIIKEVTKGVVEIGSGSGALKVGGELLKAGKGAKLLQFLGQKPAQQAIAGGASMGTSEAAKQEGATPLQQLGVGLATGVGVGGAVSALEPGANALQSLRDADIPITEKSINALKNLFAPQKQVVPPTITETTAKALQGSKEAKKALAEAAAGEAEIGGLKVGEAAKELGFLKEEVPQEFLSGSPEFQALVKKGAAYGESLLAKRQNEFLTRVSTKAREVAQKAGSTEDLSALSDDIKDTILNESKKYQADEQNLFNQLSTKPVVRTQHDPQNTISAIDTALMDSGVPETILNKIKNNQKLSAKESELFNQKFKSIRPVQKKIFETLYTDKKPTISQINDIRKQLGEFLSGEKGVFSNATRGEVENFYGLLSDDYNTALSQFPELKDVKDAAFTLTKSRKAHEENVVNLFGDELSQSLSGQVSRAIGATAKGDADKIKSILSAVPEEYRANVVATGIQNAISKQGKFDMATFTKWYNSLKGQKTAYDALFNELPPDAKYQFDNLNILSENIQNATKQTSKIGDIKQEISKNQKIGSTLWSIMKGLITGSVVYSASKQLNVPPELAIALTSAVAGGTTIRSIGKDQRQALLSLDEMLASGDFAQLVAKSKGNADMFNRSIPQFMREPVYVKFAKEVGPEAAKNLLYTSGRYLQESQEPAKKEKLALQGMYNPTK